MLPNSIFGIPLVVVEPFDFANMPLLYRSSYEGMLARIGDTKCVIATPRGQLKPLQAEKLCRTIYEETTLPCLIHAEGATAYQRRSMTERGIAWLSAEHTFSIPFLAASSERRELRAKGPKLLSANAQRIAVRVIDGSLEGMTTTKAAKALGVSLSSAANYYAELAAACPGLVGSRGRSRFLQMPDGMSRSGLYGALRPHMVNPARESTYLKVAESDTAVLDSLPLSGISALALQSEIADDPWQTRALFGTRIAEAFPNSTVVGEHDQPDVLVELWRYPSGQGSDAVDSVSLLLELEERDNEDDERLEQAISALRMEVFA